jgi:hypothetical protein
LCLVAISAIDRTSILRLEGDFSCDAALGTYYFKHLARLVCPLTLASCPAFAAASWLIFEAFLCVELLFACGENEFLPTIFASKCLVLELHPDPSLFWFVGTLLS